MEGDPRFVGIDVSKAQLDVAVRPTGKRWTLPYDETGIEGLIPQIVDPGAALGGRPGRYGTAGGVVNPRQVRDFARPPVRWPRPTLWTRGSWPISPTPSVLR